MMPPTCHEKGWGQNYNASIQLQSKKEINCDNESVPWDAKEKTEANNFNNSRKRMKTKGHPIVFGQVCQN